MPHPIEQYCDLFISRDDLIRADRPLVNDGPSVTYSLKNKITIPSRNDEQVIEITRLDLNPKFYYKAVPVLTPNVYRLADLINTSDVVLLPGEATMYLGGDFVGSTKLPLVAVGKPFTVGLGVDPQLQVSRILVDRTRTTQGGNQVLTFKYRVMLSSYKSVTVPVQVWDRTAAPSRPRSTGDRNQEWHQLHCTVGMTPVNVCRCGYPSARKQHSPSTTSSRWSRM